MIFWNRSARPAHPPSWQSHDSQSFVTHPASVKRLWRAPLLLLAFLLAGLLTAFQLGMTLLQPSWKESVTDWLRAALAWPELLALVLTSLWLTRLRRRESRAWWMISAGFLMYAIAQTLWGVGEQVLFPNGVPSPWWSDLFYLLQYPCFFLALTLLPRLPPGGQPVLTRLKMLLDCLLVMAAATALSWYFLLAPLYRQSGESLLGKIATLAYPIGDLGVLFGLMLVLVYRRSVERSVLVLLMGSVTCLALADSWSANMTLHTTYMGGNPPDLFWVVCYLLFPLAGLVQLRLTQHDDSAKQEQKLQTFLREPTSKGGVIGSFRFLLPFVTALLAGGVIVVQATVGADDQSHLLVPLVVAFGLQLLVIARQELTFLEGEHWRHEREVAKANELMALQETNRRMDTFLGVASHELKTPLTSIKLGLQMHARRLRRLDQRNEATELEWEPLLEGFALVERQENRLERLVNDLLDVSRIQANKLVLRLAPCDLAVIVREAVDEQRQAAPQRATRVYLPVDQQVPLLADADRIGQVVTNYLTNALKYSAEDRPVEVGLERVAGTARVWVRDEGPGIPPEEQAHIWERFQRAQGVEVQTGTGVGLGLGLYICRTLIEGHQGQVGVESVPGQGSTFWFALPLARV